MDDKPRVLHEIQKFLSNFSEQGLVAQEIIPQTMHGKGLFRHGALGIYIFVESAARRHVVIELDRADLDDAVAGFRFKTSGFRVEDDFTHGLPFAVCHAG